MLTILMRTLVRSRRYIISFVFFLFRWEEPTAYSLHKIPRDTFKFHLQTLCKIFITAVYCRNSCYAFKLRNVSCQKDAVSLS